MIRGNCMDISTQNVMIKHFRLFIFFNKHSSLTFNCLAHQVLSDLKRRQAEKLERLLGQNEHRLARIEKENQVLIGNEKFTIPPKKK